MSLDDAVKLMRGKPGSKITLTISREREDAPIRITITRDIIKVVSVKHRELEPGFGYLRISHFQAHTAADVSKAIEKLKKGADGALKGLVLDLRNNPGGVLNAAVAVSDAFLTQGTIVYTEGRLKDSAMSFPAAPDDELDGAPMVVLVNEGSASASEIVAGALQDHRRAVIMGRDTFGKGSVQTIIPINEKIAVKLTTARYFTPNGTSIQAEGITPDIILKALHVEEDKENGNHVKEADLRGHLENPTNGNGNGRKTGERDQVKKSLVEKDYELNEALNLLKGLSILTEDRDQA
jgi:carboxyl-terminal processing protease